MCYHNILGDIKFFQLFTFFINTKGLNQTCVHITEQQYLVSINQVSADIVHIWRHTLVLGFSFYYLLFFLLLTH